MAAQYAATGGRGEVVNHETEVILDQNGSDLGANLARGLMAVVQK